MFSRKSRIITPTSIIEHANVETVRPCSASIYVEVIPMRKMIIPFVLIPVFILSGCGSTHSAASQSQPSTISVPTLSQIKSADVSMNIPNPNGVTAITPTAPHDKAVLQKVLGWLQAAKSVGDEDPHQPMPSEGPTTLVIQLTNGKKVLVQPASNCTATGNSTVCKYAQGYIDFQYADSTKKLRLHSPKLETWLLGTWKSDLQSHQR